MIRIAPQDIDVLVTPLPVYLWERRVVAILILNAESVAIV
jgi:hypothetical protein